MATSPQRPVTSTLLCDRGGSIGASWRNSCPATSTFAAARRNGQNPGMRLGSGRLQRGQHDGQNA